jgi:hypothetical protein
VKIDASRLGNSRRLRICGSGADVGIESAGVLSSRRSGPSYWARNLRCRDADFYAMLLGVCRLGVFILERFLRETGQKGFESQWATRRRRESTSGI